MFGVKISPFPRFLRALPVTEEEDEEEEEEEDDDDEKNKKIACEKKLL